MKRSANGRTVPLLYFGALLLFVAIILYVGALCFSLVRLGLRLGEPWLYWNNRMIWYSGLPATFGLLLVALECLLQFPEKRRSACRLVSGPATNRRLTVALTAFNDELSIAQAVRDFRNHPLVDRVIVVDNNSADRTSEEAQAAGAQVVLEQQPGYGHCVYRCFSEALLYPNELIVLCEGDCTFRAQDIDKLLAYIDHANIVNGTRIVEQLREQSTQLSVFMYHGNFFVGKLLEFKHLGKGTFTDVGTTYKLVRRSSLERLMPLLNPSGVNLEFNAHFLDIALAAGEPIVEAPITFHKRVGLSKGGNTSNLRALKVGLAMIRGLTFGWKSQ